MHTAAAHFLLAIASASLIQGVSPVKARQQFQCRNQVLSATTGHLSSPLYPFNYPNNIECETTIQAKKGHIIEITFNDVDLDEGEFGSGKDRITILEGKGGVYLNFTANTDGFVRPAVFRSKSNSLSIKFKSDESGHARGFNASYESWNNVDYCDVEEFQDLRRFTAKCTDELRSGFYKTCRVKCKPDFILRQSSKVTCQNGRFVPPAPCKLIDYYVQLCDQTNMRYCPYNNDELVDYLSEKFANEELGQDEILRLGLNKIPDPEVLRADVDEEPMVKPFNQPSVIGGKSRLLWAIVNRIECTGDIGGGYSYCSRSGTGAYAFSCPIFLQMPQLPRHIAQAKMNICYICRNHDCSSSIVFQ